MAWLRRIRGRSRRERIRNEKRRTWSKGNGDREDSKKKTYMVWTLGKDGRKRLPNAALHGHVRGGRSRGRQKKRAMDNVREDLEASHTIIYGLWKNQE